jgi:O-antigen ligase
MAPQYPHRKSIFDQLEIVFHILALMTFSRGMFPLFLSEIRISDSDLGSPEIRYTVLVIYLAVGIRVFPLWRKLRAAVIAEPFLWVLVLWALISVSWSLNPEITLRRSVSFVGTTLYGVYLALQYPRVRDLLSVLVRFLLVMIAITLIVVHLFPELGTSPQGTARFWTGIYGHKNAFGRMMSLGVFVLATWAFFERRHRLLVCSLLAVAVTYLTLSDSKTGLISCFVVGVLAPFYRILLRAPPRLSVALIPFAVLGVFAVIWAGWAYIEPLTAAVGRDPTLTGRTHLWRSAWAGIMDHFLLGYGYNAFWSGPWNPLGGLGVGVVWNPNHAHNGILNLWLDLGFVGVLVFLMGYLRGFLNAARWASRKTGLEGAWPLLFFTYFTSYNVAESSIAITSGTPSVFWILFAATCTILALESKPSSTIPSNG